MKNKINIFRKITFVVSLVAASLVVSCVGDEFFRDELPGANSQEDTVFPTANFSYVSSLDDFKTINFTNLSFEATTFEWDFGGGNTSSEQDPTFTFAAGRYLSCNFNCE